MKGGGNTCEECATHAIAYHSSRPFLHDRVHGEFSLGAMPKASFPPPAAGLIRGESRSGLPLFGRVQPPSPRGSTTTASVATSVATSVVAAAAPRPAAAAAKVGPCSSAGGRAEVSPCSSSAMPETRTRKERGGKRHKK